MFNNHDNFAQKFKLNWKTSLILVILAIAIYTIGPKFVETKESVRLLRQMSPILLLFALISEFFSYFGMAYLTKVILNVLKEKIKLWELIKISFLNVFAIHVMPVSGFGSAAINYWMFKAKGVSSGKTFLIFVIRSIYIYIAIGIFLLIGTILIPAKAQLTIGQTYIVTGLIIFAFSFLGYWIWLYYHKLTFYAHFRTLGRMVNWVSLKVTKKPLASTDKVEHIVDDIYRGMNLFNKKRNYVFLSILGALLWWGADMLTLALVMLSFGYKIQIGVLFFVYCIANILALFTFIPGGLGVMEGSLALLFVGFGVPGATAWFSVLAYRLISFWLPIPVGIVSFGSLIRGIKTKKNREVQEFSKV